MKRCILIAIAALLLALPAGAQKTQTRTRQFVYPPLRAFFTRNPGVHSVRYTVRPGRLPVLRLVTDVQKGSLYSHNLDFSGDRYLFERQHGAWTLPDSLLRMKRNPKAVEHYVEVTVRQDSVFVELTEVFPQKKKPVRKGDDEVDYDQVFTKVEKPVLPVRGLPVLGREAAAALSALPAPGALGDSVFLFQLLIKKDSSVQTYRQLAGDTTAAGSALRGVLDRSGPWSPSEECGRGVHTYLKVFMRVQPDHSVYIELPKRH
ncbi:hypothetical protein [Flaviaesturariibacter amylovorans]|uniref:DUF4138 domain-containing protein n=1 Tax=Flaviaesturariibacter amylovorans TaxID=1084520 RepID=A0ABP8HV13_9BACT